ncbi:low specificity L-threonine aldolase [Geobacter sulfurreducens]|uniref:L-threonine aldolase n=1 Tax=Geobacter sulfurreducens (strain ATCC 51573 / DSM 12127 / PCA) TaxID=243231 RepID=Q746W0_GEOSL|nr:low specificity L-threonine aldolase [Geobacter sulfurreducens]AAR36798.1 L-threonine aldolase, low-specificity [Geobacter sulfurreducens PCA]AJY69662.1 threonine aldolase [Geobacter sulfurreducens]UAC04056.1 low specificity L-threonine aldolase [Geobacter sulfurreducens]UTG92692.1 low specificity L-threonine aldolase [Geobacter sulfurreducens]HBB70079.1 low specificity L-threonine aldolase [Geobacter sulfurreducens]
MNNCTTTERRNQFASDNYAGICPEAWQAMEEANRGYACSYGDDTWTERACRLLRDTFETDCEVFFVFNGTAANSLALASLCQSYHSIICHETSHIETDECGAAEFFSNGTKILLVPGPHGKVDPDAVEHTVKRRLDIHYPKPKVLSITQATELGTLYSVDELRELGHLARRLDLRVHMDGARFANAVAALGVHPSEITWKAGVDVLCFGGTKNGMAVGEAVVFFNRELAREFDYRCKQAGQLASKMRFLAAPWIGMLESGAWLTRSAHANACAARLEARLRDIPGVGIRFPRQANSVFADLPPGVVDALHGLGWHFYTFIGSGGARFMCSWETSDQDIDLLATDIAGCCNR